MRKLLIGAQFLGHQLLSTAGVPILVAFVVIESFAAVRNAGSWVQMRSAHQLLTETHIFALQWLCALILGYLLHRKFHHASILVVWILPTLLFLIVFIHWHNFTVFDSAFESRLSHFFGTACEVRNGCIDQVIYTMPLYCAIAYSVGGLLNRTMAANSFSHRALKDRWR